MKPYQYQYTYHYPSTSIITTPIHALVNILFTFRSDKNEKIDYMKHQFKILSTGNSDFDCKIREALLIKSEKPTLDQ